MTLQIGIYQHFKGNHYRVIDTVKHSETEETLVLYHPLYGSDENQKQLWVRPLSMFTGTKMIDGKPIKRFTLVTL